MTTRRPTNRMFEFQAVVLHYELSPQSKEVAYSSAVRSDRAMNFYRAIFKSFDKDVQIRLAKRLGVKLKDYDYDE
jgi:hypothetical protein